MTERPPACRFSFDGQSIEAREGQTVAGALHSAGRHVLSRSFKYHRPRGLFCVSGRCPNCLCTVDGEPNVRICTRTAEEGLRVSSQNRWPSLKFDMLAILDRLHRFMPVGFYYKTMHKPRFLWPVFERFIRRIAGLGSIDRAQGGRERYDKLNQHADVAVIGGGWAGLHAVLEVARAGVSVTLIDEQAALGGHMRHDAEANRSDLEEVLAEVASNDLITVLDSAIVFGCYEENLLGIQRGRRLIRLRASEVIVATGGWDRPYVFENNDLPGNLLAGGALRLLNLDGCRLDGPIVVVTDNISGYRAARQFSQAGMDVAAIVDLNRTTSGTADSIPVKTGQTIRAALGRQHVSAAVIESIDGGDATQTIACRWIVQAIGFQPATSLLYQSGSKLKFDPQLGHARVKEYADGVGSAGAVNGLQDRDLCAVDGRRAGLDALRNLGRLDSDGVRRLTEFTQQVEQSCGTEQTGGGQFLSSSTAKKKFVCLCEDVTEKDVYDAIDEGYANIETLKRYSTISMGPCQGKMCQASAIALCARHNGRTIEETGTTTSRPPEQPVPLGVLAGRAPTFGLTRRTAMHDWHTLAGATHLDAGAWKRPEHYGDPDQEYEAVRNRAGLVDVSTLGKLELRGPDVAEFLEFVYPNRFQGLKSGRARYGVLCDEAGILLDDGTISRLDEERFLLTTTTGNAAAVDGWFRWWLTCRPELNVSLTNMTSCFAAMNLAGPNSREILSKLTGVDLSNEALPYLSAAEFEVAGVTATVLRLGFVGELGYEIHVPTQFGLHVWESLLDAGQELGIRPFGVEAQRRLRLDKQHLLPGVDTDALSNPLEAGLPWIVKLDKDDFIGRSSLARAQQRGLQQALVGFVLPGREVPHEASLVVRGNRLAGRVTSARYSPVAGAVVGLAWVNADQASNGEQIAIRTDSGTAKAVVQREPFYDPDGLKLKS